MPKPTLFQLVQGHGGFPVTPQLNVPQLPAYSPIPYPAMPANQAGVGDMQVAQSAMTGGAPGGTPGPVPAPQTAQTVAPPASAGGTPAAASQAATPPPAPPLTLSANIPGMVGGGKLTMQVPREKFDDVWEHVKGAFIPQPGQNGAVMGNVPAFENGGGLSIAGIGGAVGAPDGGVVPGFLGVDATGNTMLPNSDPTSGNMPVLNPTVISYANTVSSGLGDRLMTDPVKYQQFVDSLSGDPGYNHYLSLLSTGSGGGSGAGGYSDLANAYLAMTGMQTAEQAREYNQTYGQNKALAESQDQQARANLMNTFYNDLATQQLQRQQLGLTAGNDALTATQNALQQAYVPGLTDGHYNPMSSNAADRALNVPTYDVNVGQALGSSIMPQPNMPSPQLGPALNIPAMGANKGQGQ